jgi:hypothetical protein
MIPTVLDSSSAAQLQSQLDNLEGFVNKYTVKKHLAQVTEKVKMRIYFDPSLIFFIFLVFCGGVLLYHFYTLWEKHKKEKLNPREQDRKIDWSKVDSTVNLI